MTTGSLAAPVRTDIVVEVDQARAFDVFCHDMNSWWPADKHILRGELAEMVFEPRVGGAIYDRGTDGTVCRWARVLAYDPPERVVFSWDISLAWEAETDPERASEVEVRFVPDGPGRTRVELEHRHLERHGDGWESMRDAVASPNGWGDALRSFAAYLTR